MLGIDLKDNFSAVRSFFHSCDTKCTGLHDIEFKIKESDGTKVLFTSVYGSLI